MDPSSVAGDLLKFEEPPCVKVKVRQGVYLFMHVVVQHILKLIPDLTFLEVRLMYVYM